jgi:hypothetical protein
MPELTVPLPLWIASQVFAFIALAIIVFGFQVKRKRNTMFCLACACAVIAVSVAFLENWVVFAIMAVATCRNFQVALFEHLRDKGKKINKYIEMAILALFVIAYIVPIIFTWVWWLDWALLSVSLVILLAGTIKGIHLLRVASICYESLMIVNNVRFFNIIGIVTSSISISSILLFYVRFIWKNKTPF